MPEKSMLGAPPSPLPYARYALAMLLGVYTLNFVDRIILGILVPPIKAELHLTDTELGLLGGTAFAIFYTALGIPIGWLADRINRVWIIAVSLGLWSAFTAAGGLAQGFGQLFVARLGVGIGEAGGAAPSYSLISDFFAPAQRARALSVYSFGVPIGSAAGLLFGGLIAASIHWRVALITVGIVGLIFAPCFGLGVREPARGALDVVRRAPISPPLPKARRALFGKVSFWSLALGGAMSSIIGYGLLFWLPSLLLRSYHLSLRQVAWYQAALALSSGVIGLWIGGWLTDQLGSRHRSAYALVPAVAFALCAPLYAGLISLPPVLWVLPWLLIPAALALVWLGPTICAVQHLVSADQRAFASASFLFVNNLIGLGLGTLIIGHLSDHFKAHYGDESLRYAILVGLGFYWLAALMYALAARHLARDWHD